MVYNVHSLYHLTDDALKFGPLDRISAFPFENSMQYLLKMLRGKNNYHLQQVVNRIYERNSIGIVSNPVHSATLPSVKVSTKPGDNCFLTTTGEVVIIKDLMNETFKYRVCETRALKDYPCDSTDLSIFKIDGYGQLQTGQVSMLKRKCVIVPAKNSASSIEFFCFPHTFELNS